MFLGRSHGGAVPTLSCMEAGDPAVAMDVYLTALWLVALDSVLSELANPSADRGAQTVTSSKPSN